MESKQELIKKLKETQRDLQWQYDMELYRLENNLKKKEKAIDDLNASLFKITQENMEKDKIIEALEEQLKQMNIKTDLEKRVAYLEERLEPVELVVSVAKEKLEVGKWYHTTAFSIEELKELLPVGTKVEVEVHLQCCDEVTEPPDVTMVCEVKKVVEGNETDKVYISVGKAFYREWFKIIKE